MAFWNFVFGLHYGFHILKCALLKSTILSCACSQVDRTFLRNGQLVLPLHCLLRGIVRKQAGCFMESRQFEKIPELRAVSTYSMFQHSLRRCRSWREWGTASKGPWWWLGFCMKVEHGKHLSQQYGTNLWRCVSMEKISFSYFSVL